MYTGEENAEKSAAVKVLCCRIVKRSHYHDGPLLDLLQEFDHRSHICGERKRSVMYTLPKMFYFNFVFKGKYSPPAHMSKDAVFRSSPVLPVGGGTMYNRLRQNRQELQIKAVRLVTECYR